jgi:hypothetical protein
MTLTALAAVRWQPSSRGEARWARRAWTDPSRVQPCYKVQPGYRAVHNSSCCTICYLWVPFLQAGAPFLSAEAAFAPTTADSSRRIVDVLLTGLSVSTSSTSSNERPYSEWSGQLWRYTAALALCVCRYYHPANLTISIVGDVDPGRVQQLAEKYFGSWAAAPGAVTLNSSIQQLAAEPLPQPAALAAAAASKAAPAGALAAIGAAAAAAAAAPLSQLGSTGVKQPSSSSSMLWDRAGAGSSSSSREFRQRTAAGPLLAMGYYRPSVTGRRGTAMEVSGMHSYVVFLHIMLLPLLHK